MSPERTVAQNTLWLVLQPLLMNALSLTATGYIARQLGASQFGQFNLALAFVAMFAPLTNLGVRAVTGRYIAKNRQAAADYLGTVLFLRLGLALAAAAATILAAPYSGGSGAARDVVVISALVMVLATAAQVWVDGFQAFELMRPVSVANFVGGLLLTIASVAVVYAGGDVRHLALAYALGPLCSLALMFWWSRKLPFHPRPVWSVPEFVHILRAGLPFFGMSLLTVINNRVDVLVVARLLGETSLLGCYTGSMSLIDRAMALCDGAATALLPAIAHLGMHAQTKTRSLLRKSAVWLLLVSLPAALITSVLAPVIVGVIFGPQYGAAAPVLAMGIWRLPAMCLAMLMGHALFAAGRQDLEIRTGMIACVASIALVLPLVSWFGAPGGALALAAGPLLGILLRLPAVSHHYPGFWPWAQLARVIAAVATMSIPLSFARSLDVGGRLAALVMLALALYAVSLAVSGVLPFRPLFNQLGRRRSPATVGGAWATESGQGCDAP